ncbi:MAG: ammonium transporter [Verrucomicrobia bacterium]|nr:ammonium transporter [Verrucomicrobiota bacterium]
MIRKNILNKIPLAALAISLLAWAGTSPAQTPEPAAPAAVAPATDPVPAPAPTPAPTAAPAAVTPAAADPAAAAGPREAKLEERVNDIEQYFTNLAPGPAADSKDPYKSKLAGLAGPGHNAFMMICTALVLFMTLPGLALFYGGLVRKKNVLSVIAQCFACAGLVTILWVVCGYSFVFGEHPAVDAPSWAPFLGSFKYFFMEGVDSATNTNYTAWPSQNVFSMYQLMFAIITPALIVGAIAERMKFSAIMLFITLWMFAVYFPLAHMVWGFDGFMNGVWNGSAKIRAIDFAGGTVVHMSSGWSALILCILLGKRQGFGKQPMAPHSMVLCAVGTGMLWVGWYGFNAGSALAADGVAANAFTTTTVATAVACFVWPMLEYIKGGKPSILGFCSGAVAGLVVVTPACGFITIKGALIIGILAGVVPFIFCTTVKKIFGYDDALDTFGVHAVGGTLGALVTGFLATDKVNSNLTGSYAKANGLDKLVTEGGLWMEQVKAIGLTIALAIAATLVIAFIVKMIVGLRVSPEVEDAGLDTSEHGEAGYEM